MAAVVPDSYRGQPGVPALPFTDLTEALGRLAAAFYNEPSQRMTVIGVTGIPERSFWDSLLKGRPCCCVPHSSPTPWHYCSCRMSPADTQHCEVWQDRNTITHIWATNS